MFRAIRRIYCESNSARRFPSGTATMLRIYSNNVQIRRVASVNMADNLRREGKFDEALSILAMESFDTKVLESCDFNVAKIYFSCLLESRKLLKYERESELLIRWLSDQYKINSQPSLETVVGIKCILADLHIQKKNYIKAEELLTPLLLQINSFSTVDMTRVCSLLGRCYLYLERYDKAEQVLRYAYTLVSKDNVFDCYVASLMDTLATVLITGDAISEQTLQSNKDEGIALLGLLYKLNIQTYGPDHRLSLRSAANLAMFESMNGRVDEAEELLCNTLSSQKQLLGEMHDDVTVTTVYLADLYGNLGLLDESERLWRTALNNNVSNYGNECEDSISYRWSLCNILVKLERWVDALAEIDEVRRRNSAIVTTDPVQIMERSEIECLLGEILVSLQRYDDAILVFEKLSKELSDNTSSEARSVRIRVLTRLGTLCLQCLTLTGCDNSPQSNKYKSTSYKCLSAVVSSFRSFADVDGLDYEDKNQYCKSLSSLSTLYLFVLNSAENRNEFQFEDGISISHSELLALIEEGYQQAIILATGLAQDGADPALLSGIQHNLAMFYFNEVGNYSKALDILQPMVDSMLEVLSYENAQVLNVLWPLCVCVANSGDCNQAIHYTVMYCKGADKLYGKNSSEMQRGAELLSKLNNFVVLSDDGVELDLEGIEKVGSRGDRTDDNKVTAEFATNDLDENILQRFKKK